MIIYGTDQLLDFSELCDLLEKNEIINKFYSYFSNMNKLIDLRQEFKETRKQFVYEKQNDSGWQQQEWKTQKPRTIEQINEILSERERELNEKSISNLIHTLKITKIVILMMLQ
jgi:hypothetical protein